MQNPPAVGVDQDGGTRRGEARSAYREGKSNNRKQPREHQLLHLIEYRRTLEYNFPPPVTSHWIGGAVGGPAMTGTGWVSGSATTIAQNTLYLNPGAWATAMPMRVAWGISMFFL